jgi:hypothetical protein
VKVDVAEFVRSLGRVVSAGVALGHVRSLVLVLVVRSTFADRELKGVRLNR